MSNLESAPIPEIEPQKKNNTVLIVSIVAVVLICCCCACLGVAGISWLWENGDMLFNL